LEDNDNSSSSATASRSSKRTKVKIDVASLPTRPRQVATLVAPAAETVEITLPGPTGQKRQYLLQEAAAAAAAAAEQPELQQDDLISNATKMSNTVKSIVDSVHFDISDSDSQIANSSALATDEELISAGNKSSTNNEDKLSSANNKTDIDGGETYTENENKNTSTLTQSEAHEVLQKHTLGFLDQQLLAPLFRSALRVEEPLVRCKPFFDLEPALLEGIWVPCRWKIEDFFGLRDPVVCTALGNTVGSATTTLSTEQIEEFCLSAWRQNSRHLAVAASAMDNNNNQAGPHLNLPNLSDLAAAQAKNSTYSGSGTAAGVATMAQFAGGYVSSVHLSRMLHGQAEKLSTRLKLALIHTVQTRPKLLERGSGTDFIGISERRPGVSFRQLKNGEITFFPRGNSVPVEYSRPDGTIEVHMQLKGKKHKAHLIYDSYLLWDDGDIWERVASLPETF